MNLNVSGNCDYQVLNNGFQFKSYVIGFTFSSADIDLFCEIKRVSNSVDCNQFPHLSRWFCHIENLYDNVRYPSKSKDTLDDIESIKMVTHENISNYSNDELAEYLLSLIDQRQVIASYDLADELKIDHQKLVGAIKSLASIPELVNAELITSKRNQLTSEGELIAKNGSHEAVIFNAVPAEDGIAQSSLMKLNKNAKFGFAKAMSNNWIVLDKSAEGGAKVLRKVEAITDDVRDALLAVKNNNEDTSLTDSIKVDLKKRKLLTETQTKSYIVGKGSKFSLQITKPETDLTADMLAHGSGTSWRDLAFKPYNFDALGVPPPAAHLHPLLQVRSEFRQIFLEMGFTEMPTNNYVESSFWNFDALFQPQQHPARDAHDTFFISSPRLSKQFPMDYLEKVKKVHSVGAHGSQGYKYNWKIEEAQKNLLRTHTTAVSARMLYKLAQQEVFTPVKYFSIDRVFRNETLDATHLAEFHQVEGVIADRGLSLSHLIGILSVFYKKLGINQLRYKPAYNPYTEPSMEIFGYHEGLEKWIELGNSGVFRPEMLLPMGLPEDVQVIAWGVSLERPTMIKYGVDNIRDLIGPKVDLAVVQDAPLCRITEI